MTRRLSLMATLSAPVADLLESGSSLAAAIATVAHDRTAQGLAPLEPNGRRIDLAVWYPKIFAHHLGPIEDWEATHTPEQTIEVLRGFVRFRG